MMTGILTNREDIIIDKSDALCIDVHMDDAYTYPLF
jgi:hypothetical protein